MTGRRTAKMTISVRDRLRLLALLRVAGLGWLSALVGLIGTAALTPPGTAVALAFLVGRVHRHPGAGSDSAMVAPLLAFAAVLITGHLLDAMRVPVFYVVQSRIDGAHRAEVVRLASTSDTIDGLERSAVQRLIRETRADPENWTERTPGAGAVSQLATFGRAITLISSGVVVSAYAWWMIPLLIVPALLFQQFNRRGAMNWYRAWLRNSGELLHIRLWSAAIVSSGEGKDLRVFGLDEWTLEQVENHTATLYRGVFATAKRQIAAQWQQLVLLLVPMVVAFLAVVEAAVAGRTSLAVAMAVLSASAGVYRVFGGEARDVVGGIASLRALDELRRQLNERVRQPTETCGRLAIDGIQAVMERQRPATIRFEGVSFAYPGAERRVLHEFNLEIAPGELLAIVGLNGAGKSTLIKLLAGLYAPDEGRITVGGEDVAKIPPVLWRRQISIVFQDFVRYHLSAVDNVALGNGTAPVDRDAIEEASRAAGFGQVLARLPHGWDTPLARTRSGGVELSGGQWQQVALARALYAVRTGAWLLVLDEPTAHLDVRTEFEVFERLIKHKRDATVLLISHRLSTVRQADRIVLLEGGQAIESGKHDELIATGGRYAELFAIQADRFKRGYDDNLDEE